MPQSKYWPTQLVIFPLKAELEVSYCLASKGQAGWPANPPVIDLGAVVAGGPVLAVSLLCRGNQARGSFGTLWSRGFQASPDQLLARTWLVCSCSFSVLLQLAQGNARCELPLSQDRKYSFAVWTPWDLGLVTSALSSLCWLIHLHYENRIYPKFQTYRLDIIHIIQRLRLDQES